jgi:uncharacterized protein Ymh
MSDQHLQKLLNLTPSEYGEALINKAFSPQAGALALQTHGNQQRGLRDLAIGANALFRNAVAHKTVFNPDPSIIGSASSGHEQR